MPASDIICKFHNRREVRFRTTNWLRREYLSCVRVHNEAQHQQFLSITSLLATGDPPAKNSRAHALINNKFVRRETRLEEHKFHSNSFQWAAAVGSINRDSFDVEVGLSMIACLELAHDLNSLWRRKEEISNIPKLEQIYAELN